MRDDQVDEKSTATNSMQFSYDFNTTSRLTLGETLLVEKMHKKENPTIEIIDCLIEAKSAIEQINRSGQTDSTSSSSSSSSSRNTNSCVINENEINIEMLKRQFGSDFINSGASSTSSASTISTNPPLSSSPDEIYTAASAAVEEDTTSANPSEARETEIARKLKEREVKVNIFNFLLLSFYGDEFFIDGKINKLQLIVFK